MAVAEALAEVLTFPDVAFDPAAAAEAMDVAVQEQQRPPDEAAQQSPAPDERVPVNNTTAPKRMAQQPPPPPEEVAQQQPAPAPVGNLARFARSHQAQLHTLPAAPPPGSGSAKKRAKQLTRSQRLGRLLEPPD